MGILRHGEAQSLCEAAAALPAALSFPCRTDSDGFTFVVVSEFAYDSRGTVIRFLNEELPAAITSAFNGRRGRREAGTGLPFQRLHQDNITDLVKRELLLALSWGVQGFLTQSNTCNRMTGGSEGCCRWDPHLWPTGWDFGTVSSSQGTRIQLT